MRKTLGVCLIAFSLATSSHAGWLDKNPPVLCMVALAGTLASLGVSVPNRLTDRAHQDWVVKTKQELTPDYVKRILETNEFDSSGRVAKVRGKTYLLSNQLIFEVQADGTLTLYQDENRMLAIRKIVSYRGDQLLALGADGKIRRCHLVERQIAWTVMDSQCKDLVATRTEAYSLSDRGSLARYQGEEGALISGYTPTNIREPAFKATGDQNVATVATSNDGKILTLTFANGRVETR